MPNPASSSRRRLRRRSTDDARDDGRRAAAREHGRERAGAEWARAAYVESRADAPPPFARGTRYPYPSGASPDGANQLDKSKGTRAAELTRGAGHVAVHVTAPGVNGLRDMGANAWEWVDHDFGGQKRTRGGSWWYGPSSMREDHLAEKPPDFPAVYIGFRCARDDQR